MREQYEERCACSSQVSDFGACVRLVLPKSVLRMNRHEMFRKRLFFSSFYSAAVIYRTVNCGSQVQVSQKVYPTKRQMYQEINLGLASQNV